jgi:hypothetical protein
MYSVLISDSFLKRVTESDSLRPCDYLADYPSKPEIAGEKDSFSRYVNSSALLGRILLPSAMNKINRINN